MRLIPMVILSTVLTACASVQAYRPAFKTGAPGFSEQKIDATHFRVMFQGEASTPRPHVEDYLLFRAAELTDEAEYDYFIITEKEMDVQTTVTSVRRPALFGRYDHFHGHGLYVFPYYAYGYDWGYPYDVETREKTRFLAIAYIEMRRGDIPPRQNHAFKALEVIDNLGPIKCWKSEGHDEGKCKLAHD